MERRDGGAPRARPGLTLPILTYHSASDLGGSAWPQLGVPLPLLERQLAALVEAGYRLMGLTDAVRAVTAPTSGRPVAALTFDDGFVDLIDVLPMLNRLGATATAYLPSAHLGGSAAWLGARASQLPRVLNASEVRGLTAAGVEVGSHSSTHAPLDLLPPARVRQEVADSRAALQQLTGTAVESFCYPFGYRSAAVVREVRAAGYATATELGHRLARPGQDEPMRLSRVMVLPGHSPQDVVFLAGHGVPGPGPAVKAALRPAWRLARRASRGRLT